MAGFTSIMDIAREAAERQRRLEEEAALRAWAAAVAQPAPPPQTLSDLVPQGYTSPNVIDQRGVNLAQVPNRLAFNPGEPAQGGMGTMVYPNEPDGSPADLFVTPPRRPAIVVDPYANAVNRIVKRATDAVAKARRQAAVQVQRRDGTDFENLPGPLGVESERYAQEDQLGDLERLFDLPRRVAQTQMARGRLSQANAEREERIRQMMATGAGVTRAQAERRIDEIDAREGRPGITGALAKAYDIIMDTPTRGIGIGGPVTNRERIEKARTDIPYSGEIARGVERGVETGTSVLPAVFIADVIADQLPYTMKPSEVYGNIAGLLVPREVWELALELVPGVGTVPDLMRAAKRGVPEARAAVRQVLDSPRGQSILRELASERGSLEFPPSDEFDDILKNATGGDGASLDQPLGDPNTRLRGLKDAWETQGPEGALPGEPAPRAETAQPEALPDTPPTIREIEARSAPLTPEQRARMPRETEQAFYQPRDFAEATDFDVADPTGVTGGTLQRVQDLTTKIPVLKSFMQFAEPIAGARASARTGNIIPQAIVRRDLYADTERSLARAHMYAWIEDSRELLGLNGKGIARNVGVRVDAEIPPAVRGRIDDIIEHPEDYVLTPEQSTAIDRARQSFNAVTQHQLEAGVDVREIEGGYFPRIVTKSPKGEPVKGSGGGLGRRPGHTKAREFTDLREGIEAGYEYASPYEAMLARLESGIDSIASRRTLETVKALGQKPSERVPQELRERYLAAKAAYIGEKGQPAVKTPEMARELEEAKRALRVAARKANDPNIGETKAFGRIFPKAVTDEIAKYTENIDPNIIEEYFRMQRASTTTADLSAAMIQGHNLFFRNNVAWWKAFGHSLVSIANEPMGYIARNIDDVEQAIAARAAIPPAEFQLAKGGKLAQLGAKLPVVKQAQRAFEWMIFVAQVEWWKAARRMGMSAEEAAELGAVIRKGTGSMMRPGLTNKQRAVEPWTFFATRFMMAVNAFGADALRGGVRGAEARRTLGSVFAGATAATIAAQMATDGKMPNLTDPNDRDRPWLGVKRPGGTINFFGPLYPYMKAYAAIAQDVAHGDTQSAKDEAIFLARSRLSLPLSSLIDIIYDEDVMGNPVRGPKDFATAQAKRWLPMSGREFMENGLEGQAEFPEGNLTGLGLRTSRASDFRQTVNAAEPYIEAAEGDFRAAYNAAATAGDIEAQDGIRARWRADFEQRTAGSGLRIIPGDFVERGENDLARGPQIEIDAVERIWKDEGWEAAVRDQLVAAWDYPGEGSQRIKAIAASLSGFESKSDMRKAFAERAAAEYVRLYGGTIATAKDALEKDLDSLQEAKNYDKAKQYDRLEFWRQHPDWLYEAWLLGIEDDNEAEREIMEEAGFAVY